MHPLSKVAVAAALLTLAGAGVAQMRIQPVRQAPIANPAVQQAMVDPVAHNTARINQLVKKTRALEGRIATLEDALRAARAASEFTCSTATTSTNGRGSEDCTPYACNYLDGRCRTTAVSSAQCAPGFLWDNNRCVAPPPPAPDDDCFMGFLC